MSFDHLKFEVSYNPNLAADLKTYVFPDKQIDELDKLLNELNQKDPNLFYIIDRYLDIRELIYHLTIVAEEAERQHFIFHGQEIVHIDYDIDSLNLYLIMSAIDLIASGGTKKKVTGHQKFEVWIADKANLADYDKEKELDIYLKEKYDEYLKTYGMRKGIERVFNSIPSEFKEEFAKNTLFVKVKSVDSFREAIRQSENCLKYGDRYNSIIGFFATSRNNYTHSMKRTHRPKGHEGSYVLFQGDDLHSFVNGTLSKPVGCLVVDSRFDIYEKLIEVSRYYCAKLINDCVK